MGGGGDWHFYPKPPLISDSAFVSSRLQNCSCFCTSNVWFVIVFRVFKGSDDVRLMRPASPESRSPDTNQGPARSVTPPTAAEPDTTQSGPSRETTEGLVTMMRCVCGLFLLMICAFFVWISSLHSWFVWHRTLLRYFFPPDFRIPKDSVNTMSAEDLVAFPIVSTDQSRCYTEAF